MDDITLFDQTGVKPDAGAIIFGIRMRLVDPSAVRDYAERTILETGDEGGELTDMLAFEGNAEEAVSCMKNHGLTEDKDSWRRLRYAMLERLSSKGQKLLEDIEDVYSSLDYPADMEHLIYYMPSNEDGGSQDTLITKFHDFLKSEKEALGI